MPAGLDVHLVLDNLKTDKTRLIHDWLAKRRRWGLHFTPTSVSWLNLVECWFTLLSGRRLERGAFTSTDEPETASLAFIAETNADPKPFTWTKTAGAPVLGLRPGIAHALLAAASFLCCVPMARPAAHLVAHCGDLGISARHGAAMLSVLLVAAFASRQLWGWVSDRIGGLNTVLAGSACQAAGMALFLATQDEAGLFAVAAAFGLGFGGIVPAYELAGRELFPAAEAAWRVPALLFMTMSGMAAGSWLAGALYDRLGSYAPAFAAGIASNLLNLAVVGFLAARQERGKPRAAVLATPARASR